MSDISETVVGRRRRTWTLRGAALAAALAVAAPAWAQSAEDLNAAELGRLTTAAPPQPAMSMAMPQAAAPSAAGVPIYVPPGVAAAAPGVDCNNPYYTQYCQAYAAWVGRHYAPYDYGYANPYDDYGYYDYGYPVDVGVGFGSFRGHRFHGLRNQASFHGARFHGGFHGGGSHGGGFHGGGFHGGGHGGRGHR